MLYLCDPGGSVSFEPLGEAGKGTIGDFGRNLWCALMDSFPDIDNTVINSEMGSSEDTVTCTVSIFGTQQKEFAGIPSKGNRFESDHVFVFRFNDHQKIDRILINWNHDVFVRQLQA